ncbi:hypothetical protein B0H13DRAFT_1857160 [Mycena leptocephala]|nr:hypothetical protein B0H13DRAFT_1857160 [Mycena leptocephala]
MALARGNYYPASSTSPNQKRDVPAAMVPPTCTFSLGSEKTVLRRRVRSISRHAIVDPISSEEAAAKFADVLGVTPTCFTRHEGPCEDATDKLRDLWTALMRCEYEDPTDPIICAFCAKFLPSLISAYKADPCVNGLYHWMLLAVLQSNYFAKDLRGPLGSELYEFFVDLVLSRNHPGESITGLLIFSTYAYEYRSQIRPLPDDTVEKLKTWLRTKAEEILKFIRRKSSQLWHKKRPTIIRSHERDLDHPKYAQSLAKTLQTTSNKSRTGKTISVKSRGNFAFSDIIITSTRLEKEEMRDLSEKLEKLAGPGESTDNRSQRAGHAGTTVDKLQILQTGNGTYQQYHGTNHQASGKSKMLEYTAILAENTKAFVANNYHKPTASKPAELNSQTVHFHKRSTPEEIESDIETVFDDITVLKIYGSSILEVQVIAGKTLKEKPSKKKTYLMKSASIFGGILLPVGSKVE